MRLIISVSKSILPRIIIGVFFIIIVIGVIGYARGYRININTGKLTSTGIIAVSSSPRAASIYINDNPIAAGVTDTNLKLPHGKYTVLVKKEGYTDWKKEVILKGEIVMSLDAHLYSKNPSLTPLTNLGVSRAIPLGNTDQFLIISQTGNAKKDGLYIFNSKGQALSLYSPLSPILLKSVIPFDTDLMDMTIDFDPTYSQAIITLKNSEAQTDSAYLINLDSQPTDLNLTETKDIIVSQWQAERNLDMIKILETLPKQLRAIALDSFEVVSLSPNEKRLMYLAKKDAVLPQVIIPPLIGANQTPEARAIKKGSLYIYDKKEDKNFLVPIQIELTENMLEAGNNSSIDETQPSPTPVPQVYNEAHMNAVVEKVLWYPTSDYVAIKDRNQITLMQYDGQNRQVVYAGPFNPNFFAIAPDWNLIVIINLNPQNNQFGDLYSVGIK